MENQYVKPMTALGAAAIALTATSCSTYDDGPSSSLVSKTNRLCRVWQVDEYNGQAYTYDLSFEFEKDGDFKIEQSYYGYTYGYSGTWEWNDDKTKVHAILMGDTLNMDIRRLTTDEFWWTDDWGDQFNCIAE